LLSFGVEHIDPIRNSRRLNAMTLWHQTGDAPCRVSFGDGAWWLDLEIGIWPVEAGESVSTDLTLTPTSELTAGDREYIARQFFDADWHHEIYPHARYKELLEKRGRGRPLNDGDITDLRMWFNLAWFGPEFQVGEVCLPDETTASVRRFVEKGAGFSDDDIKAMVAEQFKIMRNVAAIHKKLQDAGQLEVSTTPFYHPILPLVHDTGAAILDREGTTLPSRFSFPEDADAQIAGAITLYERLFFTCQCAPVCHCAPDDLCCDQHRYAVCINSSIG
jgi:alpha-amylase/alpha-mannosidase (GH57 family)